MEKDKMKIKFKKLHPDAKTPFQAHPGDAGFDIYATSVKRIGLFKYQYGTGLAMEIPEGYEGEARPRSSIHKTFMLLSNAPGTIDAGYRGEIMAIFYALPFISKPYKVGERIFQLLIKPVPTVEYVETDQLSETERGTGGYGSTGK
jgi:dUTP pyrophosphatase